MESLKAATATATATARRPKRSRLSGRLEGREFLHRRRIPETLAGSLSLARQALTSHLGNSVVKPRRFTKVFVWLAALTIVTCLVSEVTRNPDEGANLGCLYLVTVGFPWSLIVVPVDITKWMSMALLIACVALNTLIIAALEKVVRGLTANRR